jgi:hypothetical protein
MIEVDPRFLLSKLAFGPSASGVEEIARIGTDRWVDEQLHPTADDGCGDRIAAARWRLKYRVPNPSFDASAPDKAPQFIEADEDRAVGAINGPIEDQWQVIEKNMPGPERTFFRQAVAVATLLRAVHSRWQLRELIVDFWHNHFNVNAAGEALVAVSLPSYDRDVIRSGGWTRPKSSDVTRHTPYLDGKITAAERPSRDSAPYCARHHLVSVFTRVASRTARLPRSRDIGALEILRYGTR